jgi:hypothetical protein
MPLAVSQPIVHRHHNFDLGSVPRPSTPSDLATGANGTFHAIASTIIAAINGLAIEPPSTPRTTARPAVRHHHDFDLNSVPELSAPSDLLAGADHTFLTIASITATTDELAIGPRPAPLVTLHPAVRRSHNLLDLNSVPGPCAPSDLAAGADDISRTIASTISVAAVVAIATGVEGPTQSRQSRQSRALDVKWPWDFGQNRWQRSKIWSRTSQIIAQISGKIPQTSGQIPHIGGQIPHIGGQIPHTGKSQEGDRMATYPPGR